MTRKPPIDPRQVTALHWGQHVDRRQTFWRGHSAIRRYVNRRVSGDPDIDAIHYASRKWFPSGLNRALSLACGHGAFDRQVARANIAHFLDGVDIAPAAIENAKSKAESEGLADRVSYFVGDFNSFVLDPDRYDGVLSFSATHHCENLEHLFSQVAKALKPTGFFVLNEYMGPTRFQVTDRQLEVMNRVLQLIPPELRTHISAQRQGKQLVKSKVARITPEALIARDPSEAVRSAEIRPLFAEYFEVVDYRPWGGSVLHFLLSDIVGNFQEGNEAHDAILNLMALAEEFLEESGYLEADCALLVGTPRS